MSEQEGLVFTERMANHVESRTKLSPASSTALQADLRNSASNGWSARAAATPRSCSASPRRHGSS